MYESFEQNKLRLVINHTSVNLMKSYSRVKVIGALMKLHNLPCRKILGNKSCSTKVSKTNHMYELVTLLREKPGGGNSSLLAHLAGNLGTIAPLDERQEMQRHKTDPPRTSAEKKRSSQPRSADIG
jgi:hypothetical protein